MAIEKRLNKVWDGVQWVEVYNPTSADLVYLNNGGLVQTAIDNLISDVETINNDIIDNLGKLGEHEARTDLHKTPADRLKLSNLPSDANSTFATKTEMAGVRRNYVVNTISQRDALVTDIPLTLDSIGDLCWVADAAADPTVDSGAALYGWAGPGAPVPAIGGWVKLAEAESMDLILDWDDIVNKPSSSVIDIDSAVTNSHTHVNKAVLDAFSFNGSELLFHGIRVAGNKVSFAPISSPRTGDIWLEEVI